MTTLVGAAPQLGVAGVLLALLGLVIRREGQDRADYRAQITSQAERHAAELARITAAHDAELAELGVQIAGLRRQLDEVNTKLDVERDRRRAVEDARRWPVDPATTQLPPQEGPPSWPAT